MAILTLNEQVSRIISENQRLRAKSAHDDGTIEIITRQYEDLVEMIKRERIEADNEIDGLRIERDQAVRAYRAMESILVQASDFIVQAVRARDGHPVELDVRKVVEQRGPEKPALRPPPVQDEAARQPQSTRPPADPQWPAAPSLQRGETGKAADKLAPARY